MTNRLAWTTAMIAGAFTSTVAAQTETTGQPAPSPSAIMQRMVDYLNGLPALECDLTIRHLTTADGMVMDYSISYSLSIDRNGRFALRHRRGMSAPDYVCDGKTLAIHLPYLAQYSIIEPPEQRFEALNPDNLGYMGDYYRAFLFDAPGMRTLLSDDPASILGAVLEQAVYIGIEETEAGLAHRIRLDDDRRHDLLIAAGEEPFPVQFSYTPSSSEWDPGEFWKDVTTTHSVTIQNWNSKPKADENRFVFTPPPGAEEVAAIGDMGDMMGGIGGEEDPAEALVGTEAAAFELENLDGKSISLTSLLEGDRIVVLDFWATWCPPCVKGLPVLAKTLSAYDENQVIFYAVNVMEDAATVRKFLDNNELSVNVLLDAKGDVSELYGVSGIPQTVVISPKGNIEAVHVGFMDGVENQLKAEIDAILAGESPAAAKRAARALDLETANIEEVWSVPGAWSAAAVTGSGEIAVLSAGGRLAHLNAAGEVLSQATIRPAGDLLRLARLVRDDATPAAITFGVWSRDVRAHGADGRTLWTYSEDQGVDDVWAADIDDDGLDEVFIGYNGSGGLHALDHEGNLLWKYTGIGNVWHVTASDLVGDQRPEVITTSARGEVHIFDQAGGKIRDLQSPFYSNMVRAAAHGSAHGAAVYAGGSSPGGGESVARMSADGEMLWTASLPGANGPIGSMSVAAAAPWLAVTTRSGQIYFYDATDGSIVATLAGHGPVGEVAYLSTPGSSEHLLLVPASDGLLALRPASH